MFLQKFRNKHTLYTTSVLSSSDLPKECNALLLFFDIEYWQPSGLFLDKYRSGSKYKIFIYITVTNFFSTNNIPTAWNSTTES